MNIKSILKKISRKIYNHDSRYEKIYAKRFAGLTEEEERYILEVQFEKMAGYKLNLDNPQTFNEKIQWLKLYYRDPLMTICSDKIAVREYVKEKIGDEYLIPCLGIYSKPEDINFDGLPDKFVIKVNWGSGQNIIVQDKKVINIKNIINKLNYWLRSENNHYYDFLEWAYKDIKSQIIIEECMANKCDIFDYKFYCFNGSPLYCFIIANDNKRNVKTLDCYDNDFNHINMRRGYKNSISTIKKPFLWCKMLEISEELSKDFLFVRVDLYENFNTIKFGELTFYPANGVSKFEPQYWDFKFGSCLEL